MKNTETKKSSTQIKRKAKKVNQGLDFVIADDIQLVANDFIEQTTELEIWKPEDLAGFEEIKIKKPNKKEKK
ncbi:hypothetical protein [Metamycoplasma equirhinis]|uniref:hypothetical protein n=1 Tax=Metamycoplasma equirhinis TaxID=92402 RepID=UPI0035943F00